MERYSLNYITKHAIDDGDKLRLANGVVISKEKDLDAGRMSKHDKHKAYPQKANLHADRSTQRDMEFYLPWVMDIAIQHLNQETGILDRDDLIQAGNEGLVRAWDNMDWKTVNNAIEEEQQAIIWNYLKTGIQFYIQRDIDNNSEQIRVPRRDIEEARANHNSVDKIYTELFPKFFDQAMDEDITSWDNEMLYEFLLDLLHKHVPNNAHRSILMQSFGIDTWDDKPVGAKKIADSFNMKVHNVWKTKERLLRMIINNEEIQEKIINYVRN